MNPKIKTIVYEVFPKIIENHIRTRSSLSSTMASLDRYRTFGYRIIEGLPETEQESNRQVLDAGYEHSVGKLQEFHAQEELSTGTVQQQESGGQP